MPLFIVLLNVRCQEELEFAAEVIRLSGFALNTDMAFKPDNSFFIFSNVDFCTYLPTLNRHKA